MGTNNSDGKHANTPLHLAPASPSWPDLLSQIDAPPEELWLRGQTEILNAPRRIAIVGSRSPTPYGVDQATRFARAFSRAGITVVSGLARGVDQAAHRAVLDEQLTAQDNNNLGASPGGTIAVLGCGVDRPWPKGDAANEMLQEGLLLSEFAPGTPPRRHHFPRRNRLISGLCQALLVVEAAYASGSLISARWAADQGRSVFALPGRIDHPMARGCHRLIKEGATLIEEPEELLQEMGWQGLPFPEPNDTSLATKPNTPKQSELLRALTGETLSADELSERTGREIGDILTELIQSEITGQVTRGPGGLFRLVT